MENTSEQTTNTTQLEMETELLLEKRQELVTSFVEAVQHKRPSKMGRVFQRLRQTNHFLNSLERIEKATSGKKTELGTAVRRQLSILARMLQRIDC